MGNDLTVSEIAELENVSRQYINAEIQRGNLVARKATPEVNAPYLVARKDYETWKKKRAQASKA